jgi:hypothetical protein
MEDESKNAVSINDDFESVLSMENNAVSSNNRETLAKSWLKLSMIDRSLFGEVDFSILTKNPEMDPRGIILNMSKSLRGLTSLYNSPVTKESFKMFILHMSRFIDLADGKTPDGRQMPGCFFTGDPFNPKKNESTGTNLFCKYPNIGERTQKFIDMICNTIILFLKKVIKEDKKLLSEQFDILDDYEGLLYAFGVMISKVYYFVGSKYSGTRLCNRFSNFVKSINTIFEKQMGRALIHQTGMDGKFMCGHGVSPAKVLINGKLKPVIVVHEGKDDGGIETNTLTKKGYTLMGGTRRRKQTLKNKKRKNTSRRNVMH